MAVLRALPGLGDMLCLLPVLRALRKALPNAHISLIGLPQSGFMRERFPHYFDEFIEFPGFPGLPERQPPIHDLPEYFRRMQERRIDLLLQMHGSGHISNPVAMLCGAAATAGFYLPNQYCPDEKFFIHYPSEEQEIWRHLRLLQHLGIPLQGDDLEFPLYDADKEALQSIPQVSILNPGRYACIHPGASLSIRRWPVQHFAAVADRLAAQGLQIVLTGSEAEKAVTGAVARHMHYPAMDLAGRTSLGALAALLSQACVLVCNDTGVSHLAAALGTPSVVVFIATSPGRWAPLDRKRHRIVGPEDHPREAIAAAEALMKEECSHAAG